jgi:hypothetical protein
MKIGIFSLIMTFFLGFSGIVKTCNYKYNDITKYNDKMAAGLNTARIINGSEKLVNKNTFEIKDIGKISQITLTQLKDNVKLDLRLCGTKGAVFSIIDNIDNVRKFSYSAKKVKFEKEGNKVNFVDLEHDGKPEFMNSGSWYFNSYLLNQDGKLLWEINDEDGTDDMAAGDLNNDGKYEFVVGLNGSGGLSLYNDKGSRLWNVKNTGNIWQVGIVDINNDKNLEIIHSDAGGDLSIVDKNGKTIRKIEPAEYLGFFFIYNPEHSTDHYIIQPSIDSFKLLDFKCKIIKTYDAKDCNDFCDIYAKSLSFGKDSGSLIALLSYPKFDRSKLLIYDSQGNIKYEEVYAETFYSICTYAKSDENTTVLLGGKEKITQLELFVKSSMKGP